MTNPIEVGGPGGPTGTANDEATAAAPSAVLDLEHLERQVDGDRQLREELLRLYLGRLTAIGPSVCGAPGPERRDAAHTLKGASLAVGAVALARLCQSIENGEDEAAPWDAALTIETTRRRVEELLRPQS